MFKATYSVVVHLAMAVLVNAGEALDIAALRAAVWSLVEHPEETPPAWFDAALEDAISRVYPD